MSLLLALTNRLPRRSGSVRVTYTVLAWKPGCVFMTPKLPFFLDRCGYLSLTEADMNGVPAGHACVAVVDSSVSLTRVLYE
jgi:hypothetical protein